MVLPIFVRLTHETEANLTGEMLEWLFIERPMGDEDSGEGHEVHEAWVGLPRAH